MKMLILKHTCDVFFTITEGFLYIWVFRCLLTPKKKLKFFGIINITTALINVIVINLLLLIPYDVQLFTNFLYSAFFPFLYLVLFYKGSLPKKLIIALIYEIIIVIIGNIFVIFWMMLGYSYAEMHEISIQYLITMIAVHLSYYIGMLFLIKIVKTSNIQLKKLETILISSILIITFFFSALSAQVATTINDAGIGMFLSISTVCLICMDIITYYILNKISKQNNIERENALLKLEQEYQKKQYEDIIIQSEQIRKLRHDYKNNFLVIRSLIENNNDTKAIEIINKDLEHINASKSHIKTNNDIVNAIVNTKMSEAFSHGIKVEFKSISDFDELDDFDLCNLISNMFDNAITAVKNCDVKLINIIIYKKNDYFVIKISNTIPQSVLDKNPELNTTKQDKASHGYGIKIIKDIAKKYNGKFDCYEDDGMFYSLVYLAPCANKTTVTV